MKCYASVCGRFRHRQYGLQQAHEVFVGSTNWHDVIRVQRGSQRSEVILRIASVVRRLYDISAGLSVAYCRQLTMRRVNYIVVARSCQGEAEMYNDVYTINTCSEWRLFTLTGSGLRALQHTSERVHETTRLWRCPATETRWPQSGNILGLFHVPVGDRETLSTSSIGWNSPAGLSHCHISHTTVNADWWDFVLNKQNSFSFVLSSSSRLLQATRPIWQKNNTQWDINNTQWDINKYKYKEKPSLWYKKTDNESHCTLMSSNHLIIISV